jgi:hypothetical protein
MCPKRALGACCTVEQQMVVGGSGITSKSITRTVFSGSPVQSDIAETSREGFIGRCEVYHTIPAGYFG